jgi:hypothetical protein
MSGPLVGFVAFEDCASAAVALNIMQEFAVRDGLTFGGLDIPCRRFSSSRKYTGGGSPRNSCSAL